MRFKKWYLLALILPLASFGAVLTYVYKNHPPAIHFPNGTVYDFGVLKEMSEFTAGFIFENTGRKPLRIGRIKTSCSCFTAASEKSVLKPGESSKINLTYLAIKDQAGRQEAVKAIVETNDPKNPHVLLTLKGEVDRVVFWYPSTVSLCCEQGDTKKYQEIRFKTFRGETLTMQCDDFSSDKVQVSCKNGDEGMVCTMYVLPTCPKGNWDETVKLTAFVDGIEKPVNIRTHLMIQ